MWLLGNSFILALWQGISPLHYERHPVEYAEDEYRRSTKYEGTCTNSNHLYYKWFIVALAVINGAALLLANVQAYRARHIRTEFSESCFIGLSFGGSSSQRPTSWLARNKSLLYPSGRHHGCCCPHPLIVPYFVTM